MSEIRELAMRALSQINAECAQAFSDGDGVGLTNSDVERLVSAAVREAYKTAALRVVVQAHKVEAANTYRGRVNNVAQFAADQLGEAANAIRAEADKLEGK